MLRDIRKSIEERLPEEMKNEIIVSDSVLEEAMEYIVRDLIYSYFIYKKDVTYETFIQNLACFLIVKYRSNK